MPMRAFPTAVWPLAGLALAAAVVGSCVASAAPVAGRNAANVKAARLVVVRAEAISGMNQSAHAYAAPGEAKYVADFPQHLDVRIVGGKATTSTRRVKFQCVNPGCLFFAPDQPDHGDRKTPSDYEIDAKGGKASLAVSIHADHPAGTSIVYVEPIAQAGERSVRAGPFTLVSR